MPMKDRAYWQRVLDLHTELRARRYPNATVLARRWNVSTKTVQRLVEQLRSDDGAPIAFDRERNGFYYTDPHWVLPFLKLDGQDLFALAVAKKVLQMYEGTPIASEMKDVYDRLASLMPSEVRVAPSALVDRLYIRRQPARPIEPAVWGRIAEALRTRTALDIRYRKPGEATGPVRRVLPYCLVLSAADWILLARDPEDDRIKMFYVARIAEVSPSSFRYAIPRDFDPDAYLGESIGLFKMAEKPFTFRVRFSKEMAPIIEEVRWHPKQRVKRLTSGELELELPCESLVEAKQFVLTYGRHARALSPPELVEEVGREIEAMKGLYRDTRHSRRSHRP